MFSATASMGKNHRFAVLEAKFALNEYPQEVVQPMKIGTPHAEADCRKSTFISIALLKFCSIKGVNR